MGQHPNKHKEKQMSTGANSKNYGKFAWFDGDTHWTNSEGKRIINWTLMSEFILEEGHMVDVHNNEGYSKMVTVGEFIKKREWGSLPNTYHYRIAK